jgi:hypothetical protein
MVYDLPAAITQWFQLRVSPRDAVVPVDHQVTSWSTAYPDLWFGGVQCSLVVYTAAILVVQLRIALGLIVQCPDLQHDDSGE